MGALHLYEQKQREMSGGGMEKEWEERRGGKLRSGCKIKKYIFKKRSNSNISWRNPPISLMRENSDPTNSMDPLLSITHALASISRVGFYVIRLGPTSIHKHMSMLASLE